MGWIKNRANKKIMEVYSDENKQIEAMCREEWRSLIPHKALFSWKSKFWDLCVRMLKWSKRRETFRIFRWILMLRLNFFYSSALLFNSNFNIFRCFLSDLSDGETQTEVDSDCFVASNEFSLTILSFIFLFCNFPFTLHVLNKHLFVVCWWTGAPQRVSLNSIFNS